MSYFTNGYLVNEENWDTDFEDFKIRLARCIDRRNFLALYAISPDVLHLALVQAFREHPKQMELTPYENDNLEELVAAAINYIAGNTFIADRELKDYLNALGGRIKEIVGRNAAMKNLQNYPKW